MYCMYFMFMGYYINILRLTIVSFWLLFSVVVVVERGGDEHTEESETRNYLH